MKSIHTLIPDIYEMIGKQGQLFSPDIAKEFSAEVTNRLVASSTEERKPSLRLSQMGPRCPRALWYSIHNPEEAEEFPAWAQIKFSYGHILEALVIAMAKEAGHEVTGEQDVVYVNGIAGHRDCVIDGCIVDVKSASSRSFVKFKDGTLAQSDSFGYLDQLDGYLVGSSDDPLVKNKDVAYILAVDKTLGHLALYRHQGRPDHIRTRVDEYKRIVDLPSPPACTCQSVPDGVSGNMKLDVNASYNIFKHVCNPALRTFLYSNGPRYLTKVVRVPDVPEVDRHGKFIYR